MELSRSAMWGSENIRRRTLADVVRSADHKSLVEAISDGEAATSSKRATLGDIYVSFQTQEAALPLTAQAVCGAVRGRPWGARGGSGRRGSVGKGKKRSKKSKGKSEGGGGAKPMVGTGTKGPHDGRRRQTIFLVESPYGKDDDTREKMIWVPHF